MSDAAVKLRTDRAVASTAGRRWLKCIVWLGTTTAIVLLGLELCIRIFGLDVPRVWQPDPVLGWRHIPGATRHFTEEGDGWIQINSLGHRDRERAIAKRNGTYRIMAIGDSMTEAVQVNLAQSYCGQLENTLNDPGRPVEVLNCGVNGYSPIQDLLMLKQEGIRYHPDLVLLGLFLDNDICDCHPELSKPLRDAPFAKVVGDRLEFNFDRPERAVREYYQQPIYSIRNWSATYRFLRAGSQRKGGAAAVASDIPLRFKIYGESAPAELEEAWRILEHVLLEFAEETKKLGAKLLIVSLPCGQEISEENWNHVLQNHPAMQNQEWDLQRHERRLAAFAKEHNLPLLQPWPQFQEANQAEPLFIGSIGHMNPAGHQLMSKIIAQFLDEHHLLPKESGSALTAQ